MAITEAPALETAESRNQQVLILIERIRSGDLSAFEEIIQRHERRILGMAIQMGLAPEDAKDACQDIFLRVFRYLAGFQADKSFEDLEDCRERRLRLAPEAQG